MRRFASLLMIICISFLGMCLDSVQTDSVYVSVAKDSAELRSSQNFLFTQGFYESSSVIRTESVKVLRNNKALENRFDRQILADLMCLIFSGNQLTVYQEEQRIERFGKLKSQTELIAYVHRQDGKS